MRLDQHITDSITVGSRFLTHKLYRKQWCCKARGTVTWGASMVKWVGYLQLNRRGRISLLVLSVFSTASKGQGNYLQLCSPLHLPSDWDILLSCSLAHSAEPLNTLINRTVDILPNNRDSKKELKLVLCSQHTLWQLFFSWRTTFYVIMNNLKVHHNIMQQKFIYLKVEITYGNVPMYNK